MIDSQLTNLLLKSPNSQLDPSMIPYIEKWGTNPSALQILEVLDYCARSSLASSFVMSVFNILLNDALVSESITYEELIKQAVWRNASN